MLYAQDSAKVADKTTEEILTPPIRVFRTRGDTPISMKELLIIITLRLCQEAAEDKL
jgi:hypothetical protein